MHELSVLTHLISQVLAAKGVHKGGKIIAITITMGELSGIDEFALKSAFPIACEGTELIGASLVLEKAPIKIKCDKCGSTSIKRFLDIECSICHSTETKIIGGHEFYLSSIELEK